MNMKPFLASLMIAAATLRNCIREKMVGGR
jgi:hypothetical protein